MLESYVEKWPTPRIENFRYMLRRWRSDAVSREILQAISGNAIEAAVNAVTSPNPSEPRWYLEWDFWVSVFTLALSVITGWLAWETRKLRQDGGESIAAAKQSADAAQKSSEAALNSARIAEETMRRTSDDLKATALLELYATYGNPRYAGIRKNAWNLIILCTGSKKYFDFFISTYFVTEYRIDGMPNEIAK
jgi:hypothetical protein